MIMKHKQAFSIRDEIGEYPNIKSDIEVIDESPFLLDPSALVRKISLWWTSRWKD